MVPKYLYRKLASSNSTSIVPTFYVNTSDSRKTLNKIKQYFKSNKDFTGEELEKLYEEFGQYKFNKDYKYIFTLKIDDCYLGEIEKYNKLLKDNAYEKYFRKGNDESLNENTYCSITGEKGRTYGYVDTLGFTVDSTAFRRNGFDKKDAYKMFPVSEKCIPILEAGQKIFLNKLSSKFINNIKYGIIPRFINIKDHNIKKEISLSFLGKSIFNINNQTANSAYGFINETEAILNEIIKDENLNKNGIYYNIIFYEQIQAQFKILLEMQDVFPSRISKILEAKKKVEDLFKFLTDYTDKKGNIISFYITLDKIHDIIFPQTKDNINKSFYELVKSIFIGQYYDDSKLIKNITDNWRKNYNEYFHDTGNDYKFYSNVKKSLVILKFLNELSIFKKLYKKEMENNNSMGKQDVFSFIKNHPEYFNKDYLKGAFIFGCLVTRLLYNQKGNAFMKKLNGLNIDKKLINKRFPELISKLRQYDKEFTEYESVAVEYLMSDDNVTKDEITFAFTAGLVIQKDFDIKNNILNKSKNNENE